MKKIYKYPTGAIVPIEATEPQNDPEVDDHINGLPKVDELDPGIGEY